MDNCIYTRNRIPIYRRCNGYYLRWYYNGWHYWYFLPGKINWLTEGEKYRTLGTQRLMMSTGQITEEQCEAIRTIKNAREIYIWTDFGWWGAVRVEDGSVVVYEHELHGEEIELTVITGSRQISKSGYSPVIIIPNTLPLMDYDDNIYDSIIINGQEWIIQNLRTTHYSNGIAIPNLTLDLDWGADVTGAYCWHNNDIFYKDPYGALYNWFAVDNANNIAYLKRGGIQEAGWRMPADTDFTNLITYLGGGLIAGGKLKETGLIHWITPNTGATNEIGFTGVGSPDRAFDGSWGSLHTTGDFWANTDDGFGGDFMQIAHNTALAQVSNGNFNYGMTIRLVRDLPIITSVRYGLLYNRFAVTDARNIAAVGWHVPTKTDYETLIAYLGGTTNAGGKLKETGLAYWDFPNEGATNESRFNARGTGDRRSDDGTFESLKVSTDFWTTTNELGSYVVLELYYATTNADLHTTFDNYGLPIRLIKNDSSLIYYTGNDGKQYPPIKIGTQVWMADNLRETKYRNGDTIPEVTDNAAWAALATGALCAYQNDWSNV